MPVTGLPSMLECTINNILQESQLSSYKIAGDLTRTTLVLRFDHKMATDNGDTKSMESPTDLSTQPINTSYRKKSPSQLRRDIHRFDQHQKRMSVDKGATGHLKYVDTIIDSRPMADNHKQNKDMVFKAEPLGFNFNSTDSAIDMSQNTSQVCQTSSTQSILPLLNKVCDKIDEVRFLSGRARGKQESGTEEETVHSNSDTDSNSSINTSIPSCHKENTGKPLVRDRFKSTHSIQAMEDKRNHYQNTISESACREIHNMKRNEGARVSQAHRNNTILKLALDTISPFDEYILVQTDDLIIEYSVENKQIENIYIRDFDYGPSPAYRRQRHMKEWPDKTDYLHQMTKYSKDLKNIELCLPLIKDLITQELDQ